MPNSNLRLKPKLLKKKLNGKEMKPKLLRMLLMKLTYLLLLIKA